MLLCGAPEEERTEIPFIETEEKAGVVITKFLRNSSILAEMRLRT